MHIIMRDIHPGRCNNYRHDAPNINGLIPQRRCLEMDGHYSPCVFDPPKSRYENPAAYVVSPNETKPWTPRKPIAMKVKSS